MSVLLLLISVLLSVVAGVCFLAGYLWYHHAFRLHEESLFPDDATGVVLLRYGIAGGFVTFGGFLLSSILWLLAGSTGTNDPSSGINPFVTLPLEEITVGLFLLSLALFVVAGSGYSADALRTRFDGVR